MFDNRKRATRKENKKRKQPKTIINGKKTKINTAYVSVGNFEPTRLRSVISQIRARKRASSAYLSASTSQH